MFTYDRMNVFGGEICMDEKELRFGPYGGRNVTRLNEKPFLLCTKKDISIHLIYRNPLSGYPFIPQTWKSERESKNSANLLVTGPDINGRYEVLYPLDIYMGIKDRYGHSGDISKREVPCVVISEKLDDLDKELLILKGNSRLCDKSDPVRRYEICEFYHIYTQKKKRGDDCPPNILKRISKDYGISTEQVRLIVTAVKKMDSTERRAFFTGKTSMKEARTALSRKVPVNPGQHNAELDTSGENFTPA